jgi:hypothetical protein
MPTVKSTQQIAGPAHQAHYLELDLSDSPSLSLSIDPNSDEQVYIGDLNVTTSSGYLLSAALPTITVSSDKLNEWFVIGAAGGETLYVCGAYISFS